MGARPAQGVAAGASSTIHDTTSANIGPNAPNLPQLPLIALRCVITEGHLSVKDVMFLTLTCSSLFQHRNELLVCCSPEELIQVALDGLRYKSLDHATTHHLLAPCPTVTVAPHLPELLQVGCRSGDVNLLAHLVQKVQDHQLVKATVFQPADINDYDDDYDDNINVYNDDYDM